MEFSNVQKHHLIKVTQEKYALFEKAKCDLYQNAAELRSQIHSQMSRLLEALQNREVQLLNQVDMIQSSKEEALQKKLSHLNFKLDRLQNIVKCSDEGNYILNEQFENFCLRDVVPDDMHMTFKPTPAGLKDVVSNFGKISSPTFVEPDNSSTSLPKRFEDYGDAEHHVLYKTVEKIKQGSNSEKSIFVNIPRLVTNEWLAKPQKQFSQSKTSRSKSNTPTVSAKDLFAPFKTSKSIDWLARSKSMPSTPNSSSIHLSELPKNTSIQNWLHQIKQNPDCEDDGFEILDTEELNSDGDTDSIEIVSSSPTSINGEIFKNAIGCKRTPDIDTSSWLAVKRKPMPLDKSLKSLATFSYFKKIASQDPNVWLVKKKSLCCNTPPKPVSCGDHRSVKSCDIENLGDSSCVENLTKKFKELSHNSKNVDPNPNPSAGSVSDLLPPVSSVCKANEVCEKYSECVSQPNCGEKNWLASVITPTDNKGAFKHINQTSPFKLDADLDQYICKDDPFQLFQAKVDKTLWLKKGKDKENIPEKCNLKQESHNVSRLYDWLSPESKKNIEVLNKHNFKF